MTVNLKNIESLQLEFDAVRLEFDGYHEQMQFYAEAYESNVFFKPKPNAPPRERIGVNLLEVFADKNWDYVANFPKISVPALPENREGAAKTEKLLYSVHEANKSEILWSQITFDGTIMSVGIKGIDVDYKKRKITYQRIDPRRAYWTSSDLNGGELEVFWSAIPMRKSAIKRKYGVDVSGSTAEGLDYWKDYDAIDINNITDDPYYMVITRVDHETLTMWCGNKFLMTSHQHELGCQPVELAIPIRIAKSNLRGDFFLRKLTQLQCEFNEAWSQRRNIVRRLGNPAVWGRNINNNQLQTVKDGMAMDGGFIGLKENGELGILTIPETQMIDRHLNDIFARMMDIAGFPPSTFGDIAGANTSGDALGMYNQPTSRKIARQNIAYKIFLQEVNKKTLILLRGLLKTGETITFDGYIPRVKKIAQQGQLVNDTSAYTMEFTKDDIVTLKTVVTCEPVTPKDDIAYKRLMFDMARENVISRTTALDEIGFLSPQDEMDLLEAESSNPSLNPKGVSALMNGEAALLSAENAGQPAGVPGYGDFIE